MGQLDRIKEARWAVRRAAIRRWQERAETRGDNRRSIEVGGEGAADSPIRNERLRAREETYEKARELRRTGRLPFAIERKIGATLDYSPLAPSDGARKAGRPVARVVELRGLGVQPEGLATSFLVTPQLLLTNHHVFPTLSDTVGMGANFLYEQSDRGLENGVLFEIDASAFYLSDEDLDFALVGIKPRSLDGRSIEEFGFVALIEATPKILIGQRVNIIQHPNGGPKQYATTQNRLIDLLDSGFLHYETDTLEGSSGSPAFSENWELVGLHHASIPEMRGDTLVATDGTDWVDEMGDDRIHWIANEGIRVSSLIKFLTGVKLEDSSQSALVTQLLRSTTDPTEEVLRVMTESPPPASYEPPSRSYAGGTMGYNTFNFSGPVSFHIYAPSQQAAAQVAPKVETPVVAPEKVIRFDRDYDNREGYDPDFLDLPVPTPSVHASRRNEILEDENGDPLVLKYHHFELMMNEKRRLQMWSAVNVDYDPDRKSRLDRKAFGSDKWIPDPRIPERVQILDSEFYKPAGNIDRGHIVRREDNAWGDTDEEIEFANSDTFHFTNCTPQHEAFNQSAPGKNDSTYIGMKGLWGDFENFIQQNLKGVDTKACILAGPVLEDNDPDADFGLGKIQYPLRFWKVIAVSVTEDGARELRVFGFLLSQKDVVTKFGIEVFRPGRFKKFQVSLAEITDLTGVVFDQNLHQADTMRGQAPHPIADGNEIMGIRRGAAAPGAAPPAA